MRVAESRCELRIKKQPECHTLPRSERDAVLRRDHQTCRQCGARQEDGVRLEVDHIVPVARGGTNDPYNLQTLCRACNQTKRDHLIS